MEKHWIDEEGHLRLDHDENYQLLQHIPTDPWLLADSWNLDQACRLILFGYIWDYQRSIEYGLRECTSASLGQDRALALITITDRFLILAKSAVAIGTIKFTDTPENWMNWAISKGYSVKHLNLNDTEIKNHVTRGVVWTNEKLTELYKFHEHERVVKKTKAFQKVTAEHFGIRITRVKQLLKKYKQSHQQGLGSLVNQQLGRSA